MKRLVWISLIVAAVAATGCKQGKDERCQVDTDCNNPSLRCNAATFTCQPTSGGGIDATVPTDARPADGAVDAPPDAMIDSM